MVYKIAEPEDILVHAQRLYPNSFHEKVSSNNLMKDLYRKAVFLSGINEVIEGGGEPVIVDAAGGSGKLWDALGESKNKKFIYIRADISREELEKGGWKFKVIGDVTHMPIADKTADAVFMLNVPIPLSKVREYVEGMKAESENEKESKRRMLEALENAEDAIYKLNLLEGVRMLKENGVMVLGAAYHGHTMKDVQDVVKNLQLQLEKFDIMELDERIVPLWKDYGIEISKPKFALVSLRKTGDDARELVEQYEQMLHNSLQELSRVGGFEKVLRDMKKWSKVKSGESFKIDKEMFSSIVFE